MELNEAETSRWNELPPNVLELIFEKYIENIKPITEFGQNTQTQQTFMLPCRLVSTSWKASMDKVLERKSMETWVNWNPKIKFPSLRFPNLLIICATPRSPTLGWAACLPSIHSGSHEECPFPTKSLALHFTPDRHIPEGYLLMGVCPFFRKTGHFLNSLQISLLHVYPDVLASILRNSPNLKALLIDWILVKRAPTKKPASLPPLPSFKKLTHLQLYGELERTKFPVSPSQRVSNWLLAACAEQLVSLDTDELPLVNTPVELNFPNLKWFKTNSCNTQAFLDAPEASHLMFSNIEHVSFVDLRFSRNMLGLLRFVGRFEKTLKSLYLNFKGYSNRNTLDLVGNEESNARFRCLSFPKLDNFGIFYPHNYKKWRVVKQFLRMFPNLRKLTFLYYEGAWRRHQEIIEEDKIEIASFMRGKRRQLLLMCPDLEQIKVDFNYESVESLYTMQF